MSNHSCERSYCGDYAVHDHDFTQILFGLNGSLGVEVDGRSVRVDATTGLVIPASRGHCYSSDLGARVFLIETTLIKDLDSVRAFRLPARWRPVADPVEILACIPLAPNILQRRAVNPDALLVRVQQTLHEDWPIARMSSFFALSIPQFHRRWKELTGKTPQSWLRNLRLDEAQILLRKGRDLNSTASIVGYRSGSALCFALNRDRGYGARELRKRPR